MRPYHCKSSTKNTQLLHASQAHKFSCSESQKDMNLWFWSPLSPGCQSQLCSIEIVDLRTTLGPGAYILRCLIAYFCQRIAHWSPRSDIRDWRHWRQAAAGAGCAGHLGWLDTKEPGGKHCFRWNGWLDATTQPIMHPMRWTMGDLTKNTAAVWLAAFAGSQHETVYLVREAPSLFKPCDTPTLWLKEEILNQLFFSYHGETSQFYLQEGTQPGPGSLPIKTHTDTHPTVKSLYTPRNDESFVGSKSCDRGCLLFFSWVQKRLRVVKHTRLLGFSLEFNRPTKATTIVRTPRTSKASVIGFVFVHPFRWMMVLIIRKCLIPFDSFQRKVLIKLGLFLQVRYLNWLTKCSSHLPFLGLFSPCLARNCR